MEKVLKAKQSTSKAKMFLQNLVSPLGISINGPNPWDVQVYDENFYQRVLQEGALGLGEAYMDKWWDCTRIDILFDKILRAKLDNQIQIPLHFKIHLLLAHIINFQSKHRAKEVADKHYDLGNQLFAAMLDSRMNYSCGYFKEAKTLEEAQIAKLDLICKKLQIKPGMRVLDVGCGWGGFAYHAAKYYGAHVTGVTISKNQADYAKTYCEGLPVSIFLKDYRDINEKFDRIVSIGMFEHVGPLNYAVYMRTLHNALMDDGIFLLHTIGINETALSANEWTLKYIFPNGSLPSIAQIAETVEKLFVMEDWHNFGAYYDHTLMAWHQNFKEKWDELKSTYDERFYRMWTYYLLSCAGAFRARTIQLWQIVFSKTGLLGGYVAPR